MDTLASVPRLLVGLGGIGWDLVVSQMDSMGVMRSMREYRDENTQILWFEDGEQRNGKAGTRVSESICYGVICFTAQTLHYSFQVIPSLVTSTFMNKHINAPPAFNRRIVDGLCVSRIYRPCLVSVLLA